VGRENKINQKENSLTHRKDESHESVKSKEDIIITLK